MYKMIIICFMTLAWLSLGTTFATRANVTAKKDFAVDRANGNETTSTASPISDIRCIFYSDCYKVVPNSHCSLSKCYCDLNYVLTRDIRAGGYICKFKPPREDKLTCSKDPHCYNVVPHSHCFLGQCYCDLGYVLTNDSDGNAICGFRKFEPPREEKLVCSKDFDCYNVVSNSHCVNTSCYCDKGYEYVRKVAFDVNQCIPRLFSESYTPSSSYTYSTSTRTGFIVIPIGAILGAIGYCCKRKKDGESSPITYPAAIPMKMTA